MTDFELSGYLMKKRFFHLFMPVLEFLCFCNCQIQDKILDISYF
jgi:hypothetical protein